MSVPDFSKRVLRLKANQEKFGNVTFQLDCLKELYETVCNKPEELEKLKKSLQKDHPNFLPQPGSCDVLIYFDAKKKPNAEFRFRSSTVPEGWLAYSSAYFNFEEVALYSAAIYQKVKEAINAGLEHSNSSTTHPDGGATIKEANNDSDNKSTTSITESNCSKHSNSPPHTAVTPKRKRQTDSFCIVNSNQAFTSTSTCSSSQTNADKVAAFLLTSEFISAKPNETVDCPICSVAYRKISLVGHCNNAHMDKKHYHCKWNGCNMFYYLEQNALDHIVKAHLVPKDQAKQFYEYDE